MSSAACPSLPLCASRLTVANVSSGLGISPGFYHITDKLESTKDPDLWLFIQHALLTQQDRPANVQARSCHSWPSSLEQSNVAGG